MAYQSSVCGDTHEDLPHIGFEWPDSYFAVPEDERGERIISDSDSCIIDNEHFFIRGVLLIPMLNQEHKLGLGIWVSQSRENFETYVNNCDSADFDPFFGWFCNSLPFYAEDTWALKTMAHFQGGGQRPLIELEPNNHPLYADYSNGISLEKA